MLATALVAGCDYPFQPFRENTETFFSIFGQLDLNADTQWIRVMPVRQDLFLEPRPIDAVVTLEHLVSGRMVTLGDSLFTFRDEALGGVGYAYNFWTTERLEPGAGYRLKAVRSDGATTTALVTMPRPMELSFRVGAVPFGSLLVHADHVAFVDVIHHFVGGGDWAVAQRKGAFVDPTTYGIGTDLFITNIEGTPPAFTAAKEIRVTTAPSDWPYRSSTKELAAALLDTIPSNVTGGFGFVGGVETRTIPYHTCESVAPRSDPSRNCVTSYDARSASIAGRVIRRPCGAPSVGAIRLAEKFSDGGADVRSWFTDESGAYRFEGIEPGADLVLELRPGVPALHLPRLAPGQRYRVEDLTGLAGC
jgi:hypothetical protein